MARPQLLSTTRTDFRKSEVKKIRREGGIPATIYSKGEESKSVFVPNDDVLAILKAGGRLSLIDLSIDGKAQKAHPVMFQTIQRNFITNKILHIDFHRVSMNEPIHAKVPLVLVGEAPGVKLSGVLEQMVSELEIKALPDHVPSHINIDISHMDIGDMIHVGEIEIPDGAELLLPAPDIAAVTVRRPTIRGIEETAEVTEAAAEAAPEA